MGRTHRAARGFAVVAAVPIAVVILTARPGVAGADPGLPDVPFLGEILSGSAGSEMPGGDAIGAPSGSALGLGTGSNSGAEGTTTGSSLGLSPVDTAGSGGAHLDTGSVSLGTTGSVADAAEEIEVPSGHADAVAQSTLGESLGLEPGSVMTACAGSAIVGGAAILLGLATGSGLGSGLVGPGFVLGSSGLVGTGSTGAGSVVLGSAVAGSAVLTCLLLLPMPVSEPGIPLGFPTVPGVVPAAVPVVPEVPVIEPAVVPPAVVVPPPPVVPHVPYQAAEEVPKPVDWSAMQMMTVIVLTILAGVRAKVGRSRNGG